MSNGSSKFDKTIKRLKEIIEEGFVLFSCRRIEIDGFLYILEAVATGLSIAREEREDGIDNMPVHLQDTSPIADLMYERASFCSTMEERIQELIQEGRRFKEEKSWIGVSEYIRGDVIAESSSDLRDSFVRKVRELDWSY